MCWIVGAIALTIVLLWAVYQSRKAVRDGTTNARRAKFAVTTRSVPETKPPIVTARPPPRVSTSLQWFGPGTTLTVGEIEISSPCTYVSRNQQAADPSEIQTQRPVTRPAGRISDLGYWPWYAHLSPQQRYGYLQWLASGKAALPEQEGYLFLYYYGLERRLLVEEQDQTWIVREILRLSSLNESRSDPRQGSSFRAYSTSLLWFMVARLPNGFDSKAFQRLCERTTQWTFESVTAALAWCAAHDTAVTPNLAFAAARLNPRSIRSVVVQRVHREFAELFARRYVEKFGRGIHPQPLGKTRQHTYRTASSAIGRVSCTISDPWGSPAQLESLADLWNSCVEDLRRLSRVDKVDAGILTPESWEALPPELRSGVDHPLQARMQAIIAEAGSEGDESLVPVGRLAALLDIPQRPKLTPTQSKSIAAAAEGTGYCVEPDVRLTGRTYEWNERLAVFLRTEDSPIEPARYNAAACMLRLGLLVATADGTSNDVELRTLGEHVDRAFEYSAGEQRRLEALRALLLRQGSDISHVSKSLERGVAQDTRRSIGRLLVAIAAAQHGIDRTELVALRKCFRVLGLTAEDLEKTIAILAPASDQSMVVVQAGASQTIIGEPIQPPSSRTEGLRLNQDAIDAIMAETKDVARLLAEAMRTGAAQELNTEPGDYSDIPPGEATPESQSNAAPTTAVTTGEASTPALAERYREFFDELVVVDRWGRSEADALARKHGLMLTGAIEAINDWAFEAHSTQLIEDDGQSLSIDLSLL